MPSRPLCAVLTLAVAGVAALAAACSGTTGLPTAVFTNVVDTVSLFALDGTPITAPSAYLLQGKARVRTDQSASLDFAFNFDSLHRPVLLPTQRLGLGALSSLQAGSAPFDAITLAPTGGWVFDSTFVLDSGRVVLVRSGATTCATGITVSLYAKLEVLAVDSTARRVAFKILVDENCGYRGLEPGIPQQ